MCAHPVAMMKLHLLKRKKISYAYVFLSYGVYLQVNAINTSFFLSFGVGCKLIKKKKPNIKATFTVGFIFIYDVAH